MNATAHNVLQCGVHDRTRLAISESVIFGIGTAKKSRVVRAWMHISC